MKTYTFTLNNNYTQYSHGQNHKCIFQLCENVNFTKKNTIHLSSFNCYCLWVIVCEGLM